MQQIYTTFMDIRVFLYNCIIVLNTTCIFTRDVFYVRRKEDLMKTTKVNAYIIHIFGKIELLSIHVT